MEIILKVKDYKDVFYNSKDGVIQEVIFHKYGNTPLILKNGMYIAYDSKEYAKEHDLKRLQRVFLKMETTVSAVLTAVEVF